MPIIRTHKQDSPLLFLDRLHTDVRIADTITSFYVRRYVYFAFFGKPTRPGPIDSGQTRDINGDTPWSPFFVGEEGPSGAYESTLHTAPTSEAPQHEREEPQRQEARLDEERQLLRRQQPPRGERERDILNRRRMRRVQTRRLLSRPTDERDQEPMELEQLSTEPSDQDMPDPSRSSQEPPDKGPKDESIPIDSATALTPHSTRGPTAEEADARSHCTRISLETGPLEPGLDDRLTVARPNQDNGLDDQAQIDHTSQPVSTEIKKENSSNVSGPSGHQQVLDEYLDQLMRAQEEQQRLEEELERERLEEELGLSNQEQPVPEFSPRPQEGQDLPPTAPDDQPGDRALVQTITPTQDPSLAFLHERHPVASTRNSSIQSPPATTEAPPPQELIEISFWSFEREEWRQSDRLQVDPSDPSPVERIARKYSRKNYSLYDKNLQSLSPAQCYRAATIDGNNAIFLISEHEEQRLVDEGRLIKDRQLLSLASRALDRAEREPKRHRPMTARGV